MMIAKAQYSTVGPLPFNLLYLARWYLDNQDWLDQVTSGDYQKYYDQMYKNR